MGAAFTTSDIVFGVRLDIRNDAVQSLASLKLPPSALAAKTVCFTGASACRIGGREIDRAMQETFAAMAGLTVQPRVTKSLDLLVVADPTVSTGKTKRAAQYGTAWMGEREFWSAVGLPVDP